MSGLRVFNAIGMLDAISSAYWKPAEALDPMTENAELPENVEISTQDADRSVQDSAADFLREYTGVLNSADFGSHGSDMSKDSDRKFASGIYEQYLRDQGR